MIRIMQAIGNPITSEWIPMYTQYSKETSMVSTLPFLKTLFSGALTLIILPTQQRITLDPSRCGPPFHRPKGLGMCDCRRK